MPARLAQVFSTEHQELLAAWLKHLRAETGPHAELMNEATLRDEASRFIRALREALATGGPEQVDGSAFDAVRTLLAEVTRDRARLGFSPSETASFVFSLKEALYPLLRAAHGTDHGALADDYRVATQLIDRLGLFTTEVHQKTREEVIDRQRAEMLELSTPVVQLWEGIVALPLIGTLDSTRTQAVMESLLQQIVAQEARIAIIDITGVPTVDTLTAQHLLKTVTATRLMGAECIISGIRPQIAQTIVHLGVDLGDITTKASLAGALSVALARIGRAIVEKQRA